MAVVSTDQNLTAVSYANAEQIDITSNATLTINSTPSVLPGNIQCLTRGKLRIENASTTTPIVLTLSDNAKDLNFEQNGIIEIRGGPISLGAATGGASETFSLNSAPLNIIPYPSLVEVETAAGSGIYHVYFVACTAGKTVHFATTEFCAAQESGRVLFWNATTRVLTAGNGTNGSLLPVGANVRVANIYIHSNTTNATPANRSQIDLNPSGTIDAEWVAFSDHFYISTTTFKRCRLFHFGICGQLELQNANVTEYLMDHVACQPDNNQNATAQQFRAGGINGPMQLKKVTVLTAGLVTANSPSLVRVTPGLTVFDDCVFARRDGRDNFADEALDIGTLSKDLIIKNLAVIGRFELTNAADLIFTNFGQAESIGTVQISTNPTDAVALTNCQRITFLGFRNAGVAAARNSLIVADAQCANIEIYNPNYDAGNNTGGLISASSAVGIKIINGAVTNMRGGGTFSDNVATFLGDRFEVRAVFSSLASGTTVLNDGGQNFIYDLLVGTPANFNATLAATGNYSFANLIDLGLTATTGSVVCGPFGENASASLSGSAHYNQNGGVNLPANGDSFTVESLFDMHGLISFQNTAPTWTYTQSSVTTADTVTAPTNISAEFRLRNPGGTYGAYQAINAANLAAALAALSGYSSNVGLFMQCRFTATATDATLSLNQVYFPTNVDNTYRAPDGTITLNGPAPTDVTTMYRVSDNAVIATFTGSGLFNFSGAAANFGLSVYLIRRNASSVVLCTLESQPFTLKVGSNGERNLFFGSEVQLAQAGDVTAVRAKVDAFLDAAISSRLAAAAYNAPSATTIANAVWDDLLTGATHNIPTSAGRRLRQLGTTLSADGALIGTPTATVLQTDLTQAVNNFYNDQTLRITSGALAGQAVPILSYNGTTKTITLSESLTSAPSAGDTFEIDSNHIHSITQIQNGLAVQSDLLAVKAKSDALVINSGLVDVNVEKMNQTEVIGTGIIGDRWRGLGAAP